jgi:hypothetical protein
MRFTVPQFIEHEAKIIGPLTFKQFVFIGAAGAICFVFYFTIGQGSFLLFLVLSILILGTGAGLAFLKIGGRGLPTILANFFRFILDSKMYIWKKGRMSIAPFKRVEIKKEVKEGELPLKIAEASQLKKIRTQIETKTK